MADIAELMKVMQEQMQLQREQMQRQDEQHKQQLALMQQQMEDTRKVGGTMAPQHQTPPFPAFDSTAELWKDYLLRFETFVNANSVPDEKKALVFLTNQTSGTYKLITNYASQQDVPTTANAMKFSDITGFMSSHYDPTQFTVRERYKFWSTIKRKPGETPTELAARVRQMATTCDFPAIKNPLDEAMRTCFICAINNEAILKSVFREKEEKLTFAKAVEIATEVEEAAKTAKAQVYSKPDEVQMIHTKKPQRNNHHHHHQKSPPSTKPSASTTARCYRCGKNGHAMKDCRLSNAVCNFCGKKGHIEAACITKQRSSKVNLITTSTIKSLTDEVKEPSPSVAVTINNRKFPFLVDTGASCNLLSSSTWKKIGTPTLQKDETRPLISASNDVIPTSGSVDLDVTVTTEDGDANSQILPFTVTDQLDILGTNAINSLQLTIRNNPVKVHVDNIRTIRSHQHLQESCLQICKEFPDLWKPELGCLKDYSLEVKFKPDVTPRFCKPRTVPFAVQEDLNQAYDVGIAKGIWKPVTFNEYGTPVVPVRKQSQPNQPSGAVRVCGDYSVFINGQLETHRQPMPLPEDLMRRLDGTHYFSKVDLADAYNQIELGPESQRRLALSTHRGVLLQTRLPFGISSATGYFQDVMNQLTSDLPGVAVYLDDILISGKTAEDHLNNLRRLLKRLNDRGLRCRIQKCVFAQDSVTYLGHTISRDGISKGPKADAVTKMPAPSNVSQLRSFLGSVQFYNKFLPDLSTISEPLYHLTEKHTKWKWEEPQQDAFQKLKQMLTNNTVLAHFDPSCPVGISCDASESGVGAVLFHRYKDNSERPIANASKTLTDAQKRYPQIQKEALSIIFALKKYHQFLYGRPFILVTDHKPLISMFGPNTATPMLAANRLARWSLMLSQYDYTIEYRSTKQHGNADALSRLPVGPDLSFDGEEGDNDVDTVCTIRVINSQLQPHSRNQLKDATNRDPVLSEVKRYVREGWPQKIDTPDVQEFKKYAASLSVTDDCLINGNRVVIPEAMQPQILDILHLGHFGMQRMKQLARSAVYWPHIDSQIEDTCKGCVSCAEHQNKPPKPANHPWMMPEKPWSRIHVDHAINFMGNNWLIVTDAYSKYPCIHQTSSTSTQATTALLEEDFAHFGYPHTIVSDNATTFSSAEFQLWCHQRGIKHLTGAPYHPATNGAAERMVQSFKQSLKKSKLPPRPALQEFLMQYRRTPLNTGFSPSQLLNGRQLRTKIDALLPSPAHIAQEHQAREATKSQQKEQTAVQHVRTAYDVGTPCYALYCGPRQTSTPRWVPATITRVHGTRTFTVKVHPRGPLWKRHLEQLRPRYGVVEDADPGIVIGEQSTSADKIPDPKAETLSPPTEAKTSDHTLPEYGRHNPRRSSRQRKTRQLYNAQ